jgi:hypothetical protein
VSERALQGTADAVHALLSVVPDAREAPLETPGQQSQVPIVQVGHSRGFLELLCLVPGIGQAGEMMSRSRPVNGFAG